MTTKIRTATVARAANFIVRSPRLNRAEDVLQAAWQKVPDDVTKDKFSAAVSVLLGTLREMIRQDELEAVIATPTRAEVKRRRRRSVAQPDLFRKGRDQ